MDSEDPPDVEPDAAWQGVSAAFAALGRTFLCLDGDFRIVHASPAIDESLGQGASQRVVGRHVSELLGPELFGPAGTLTLALLSDERREGWRAHLRLDDGAHHLVSLSAAPFSSHDHDLGEARPAFVLALRPTEQGPATETATPTSITALIARSAAMLRIFVLIENLRHSEAIVLITGESGTGKERVARSIHEHSPRRRGPFVSINAAALPAELLESEMFGHVQGAFTGAVRARVGRLEMASEGTLFLDGVDDFPPALQIKLLRVLHDGTFERLGESAPRTSRARVIAATHVDLQAAVKAGRFREDLYYRLRVVPIRVPPLRERGEDIEPLAQAILARAGARHGRALHFSPNTLRTLLRHDWPGNIRELENALEYAVAVCRGQTLLPEDLPEFVPRTSPTASGARPAARPRTSVRDAPRTAGKIRRARRAAPEDIERLRRVLEDHRWNRGAAARTLGISRTTLWRRLRDAGLI
jgi:DNA-binding NtrC family response regulator